MDCITNPPAATVAGLSTSLGVSSGLVGGFALVDSSGFAHDDLNTVVPLHPPLDAFPLDVFCRLRGLAVLTSHVGSSIVYET